MTKPVLEIKNLRTHFETPRGTIKAVNQLFLTIERGRVMALVGESGCGKSMTALSVLNLIPKPAGMIVGGEIIYHPLEGDSVDLVKLSEKQMRSIRGNRIAMIFQEPMTSLNPVFTIGNQIIEVYQVHQNLSTKQARKLAIDMLAKVGIPSPEKRIDDYPHQLSGGMRQRVMIAMALACNPDLLIADEPTTALDVTIQAQILELMKQLTSEFGMSLLLITHDLGIVAEQADKVAVMYAGQVVEQASVVEVFDNPKHPYTRGLLRSLPSRHKRGERLHAIPGTVPDLADLPKGCAIQNRCEKVHEDCQRNPPQLLGTVDGHRVRCFYPY
jgi:oligopeptide/dipeptide ABC transporter ATP-binding protein